MERGQPGRPAARRPARRAGGRDVAPHASRGQQRTIILALKLAETDLLGADGPRPIVLLDDVFSELDPERVRRASASLLAGRGQVDRHRPRTRPTLDTASSAVEAADLAHRRRAGWSRAA